MISRREQIVGVVSAVALGALVFDWFVISPLAQRKQLADASVSLAQQDLERGRQLFDNDLRARRKWADVAGDSLRPDAPTAESQVLNHLRDWAQDAGLTLVSVKPQRSEPEKGFQKVTIRAAANGSMRSVSKFIFAVQNADVPLRVSDVQVAARHEAADDLAMQISVSTIYLPPDDAKAHPKEAPR